MTQTERNVIYNAASVRLGRVSISQSAFFTMVGLKLNLDQLEETFRYGEEIAPRKIVFSYGTFEVGLFYVKDETRVWRGDLTQERFIITACWMKGG